jgi:2-oxo-4-hydroxy-4-carboxy-5-ureidoimidazoline decarboxylase
MISLRDLNDLPKESASEELFRCCGSQAWCMEMVNARPFQDKSELYLAAGRIWNNLNQNEWKTAFEHHPKIGNIESLKKKFSNTENWAGEEQSDVSSASEKVLEELAKENLRYEARFGYIFLVCATGKSASEMLEILRSRMSNTPKEEILIAAAEQEKITRIRLEKLVS